jgi:hypothetical protein
VIVEKQHKRIDEVIAEMESSEFGRTHANVSFQKNLNDRFSEQSIITSNYKIGTRVIIKNARGPNQIIYIDGVQHDSKCKINRLMPVHIQKLTDRDKYHRGGDHTLSVTGNHIRPLTCHYENAQELINMRNTMAANNLAQVLIEQLRESFYMAPKKIDAQEYEIDSTIMKA